MPPRTHLYLQTLPPTRALAWKHLWFISPGLRNPNPYSGFRIMKSHWFLASPHPAARAGGRQACSQHLTGMAQGKGVSSPWLSQQHWLPSAQPGYGAALGLADPPSPWWFLAQLPFLEGVLLSLFSQTRAYNLDSGKTNPAMLKQREQWFPSLHKMHGQSMATSCSGSALEDYTKYFVFLYDRYLNFPTCSSCILDLKRVLTNEYVHSYNSSRVVQASSFLGPVVHFVKAENIGWQTITLLLLCVSSLVSQVSKLTQESRDETHKKNFNHILL